MSKGNEEQRTPRALELIEIPNPCTVPWESMSGNNLVRFCDQCEKNVYNISGLSAREANNLILTNEGRVCVSMLKRADGTVVTDECPPLLRPIRDGVKRTVATACAIVAALGALLPSKADDTKTNDSGKDKAATKCNTNNPEPVRMGGAPIPQMFTPGQGTLEAKPVETTGSKATSPKLQDYQKSVHEQLRKNLTAQHIDLKSMTLTLSIGRDGKVKNCVVKEGATNKDLAAKACLSIKKMQFAAVPPECASGSFDCDLKF